jgi:hypothetical protein
MIARERSVHRLAAAIATTILAVGCADAATFTVGAGVACNTGSLQAAIDAARDAPGPDLIRIASDQSYTAQALRIGQQDLVLEGGYSDCTATTPTGSTVISGQGGSAAPVFTITGSGVRDLRRLSIIRGDASPLDGEGGGINFAGSGELVLSSVAVNQNRAAFGGGINFRATASPAVLSIESGTTISLNTAQISGGGIRIEGAPARLFMLRSRTSVFSNVALGVNAVTSQPEGGFGGGILALDGARLDIGSSGFGAIGAVQDNEAVRGGGIAAVANSSAQIYARLFRMAADSPPRVSGNRASSTGGGIYVGLVDGGGDTDPRVCLFGAHVEDNIAQNGAAAYADFKDLFILDAGGELLVRKWPRDAFESQICGSEHPDTLGAVRCEIGAPCNAISGNRAQTLAGVATDGAIVLAQSKTAMSLNDVSMVGNSARNLVRSFTVSSASGSIFENCLLAGNATSGELLRFSENARLDLRDCTIAGNTIGGTHVVQSDNANGGNLARSIVWQPGKPILSYPGGGANASITIDRALVSERTTLPDGPNYLGGPARFNDPLVGDWRLRISSAAVDGALPVAGDDRDLHGDPRDQLIRPLPNQLVRDAGAFERQSNAPLLVNGMFAATLSPWVVRSPPYVTYDGSTNDGTDGTGSVLLSIPIEVASGLVEAEALAQCFNVPFPGTYRLTARASAPGTVLTRDVPKLTWRRRTASAECTGAAVEQGTSFFPGAGSAFASATAVDITVPVDGFGTGSSIEVVMAVAQNANGGGALVGRFDGAELVLVTGQSTADPLFADGFEPR